MKINQPMGIWDIGLRVDGGLLYRLHQFVFAVEIATEDPGLGGAVGVPAKPVSKRDQQITSPWQTNITIENGHL